MNVGLLDVDEIAIEGRNKLVLMDNNILACEYGLEQIEKVIKKNYMVDFNQAMDARLVTDEIAKLLAKVRWHPYIRFGCDTKGQIEACAKAIDRIDRYSGRRRHYLLYTMIYGSIKERCERISFWRQDRYIKNVRCQAQPMLDFSRRHQNIPQWQKDMARWCNRKEIFATVDF